MLEPLDFVPRSELERVCAHTGDRFAAAALFADLCRVNALYMIQRAGSGHPGSSFSSLDILSWIYLHELHLPRSRAEFSERAHDICFSSKGHDAPAFYAVLIGLGLLEERFLDGLRRLGGLPGHPDVGTPFIEANTGSLGMGLSKAEGMAIANRLQKRPRKIFVLTGDGEWQEGQMWEAALSASNRGLHEITVIVDHNKIQSDIWIDAVRPLPDLQEKFESFGWRVFRCDGHDPRALSETFRKAGEETSKPKIVLADTVKGKGVSFMEGSAMKPEDRLYHFHSGALAPPDYDRAVAELRDRIENSALALGIRPIHFEKRKSSPRMSAPKPPSLIDDYARLLEVWGEKEKKLVVLDADLARDCGLLAFEKRFPERFIECGIAEQDMVSKAGGLALQGFLPVVHSFASFLSARANEQIFSNATEKTKIIYAGSLAGLLPAGPGHSHQAVRDIAALAAVPGLCLIQPCCPAELEAAFSWAVSENPRSTYLRLSSISTEIPFRLPADYRLEKGRGVSLLHGTDAILFAYGPVLLTEAWKAALLLKEKFGIGLELINLPWLNEVDRVWLEDVLAPHQRIFALDDHSLRGGQGEMLASEVNASGLAAEVRRYGVEGIPFCGENREVLKAHGLDADSLSESIALTLSIEKPSVGPGHSKQRVG